MIVLMETHLTIEGEPDEGSFPMGWFYEEDESVFREEELSPSETTASGFGPEGVVVDLKSDGILSDLEQLRKAGVRGDVHFADSCGPEYIRLSLLDEGLFRQSGEVKWTSKLEEVK